MLADNDDIIILIMHKVEHKLVSAYELKFQLALLNFLDKQVIDAKEIDDDYARLYEVIKNLILSGGKRIRPKMVIMSYLAFGGKKSDEIIPIALAVELLHQFLLIHDDVIDRDVIRYGVKNIAGTYKDIYDKLITDEAESIHYAKSAALLAGDVLHGAANAAIIDSSLDSKILKKVQLIFHQAVYDVCGGELLDTESSFKKHEDINTLVIAKYKTASYSFVAPLLIGATAADAEPATCAALRVFAEDLGIAFQLRDDLLGVFGDERKTGKSSTGDLREGKYTELIARFINLASSSQLSLYKKYFGSKDASHKQIDQLKAAILESGAKASIENLIDEHEQRALKELDFLELEDSFRLQFEELVKKSVKRSL